MDPRPNLTGRYDQKGPDSIKTTYILKLKVLDLSDPFNFYQPVEKRVKVG